MKASFISESYMFLNATFSDSKDADSGVDLFFWPFFFSDFEKDFKKVIFQDHAE